jgi:hypothetical protein
MDEQPDERVASDVLELDRRAWNLPRPVKPPRTSQAPLSVQSAREDATEPEPEPA